MLIRITATGYYNRIGDLRLTLLRRGQDLPYIRTLCSDNGDNDNGDYVCQSGSDVVVVERENGRKIIEVSPLTSR